MVPGEHSALTGLQLTLFSFLFRNAVRASDRFNLPAGRTMEVVRQVVV